MPGLPLLTVSFGEPEHGWLPVMLQAGDFEVQFYASGVPSNPLESLCEAVAIISTEGRAQVVWNL
jgi:hypothetical protein